MRAVLGIRPTVVAIALILSNLTIVPSARSEPTNFVSVYGGKQFQRHWSRFFKAPHQLDFYNDYVVGISGGREWPMIWPNFVGGFEVQANLHFGTQEYFEFGAPLIIRYTPPEWRVPVRSFGGGLGISATTKVPDVEIDKGGASQKVLFYWYLEAEFGRRTSSTSTFLRIHHRSWGFGTFNQPGSSNAVVLGLRQRF